MSGKDMVDRLRALERQVAVARIFAAVFAVGLLASLGLAGYAVARKPEVAPAPSLPSIAVIPTPVTRIESPRMPIGVDLPSRPPKVDYADLEKLSIVARKSAFKYCQNAGLLGSKWIKPGNAAFLIEIECMGIKTQYTYYLEHGEIIGDRLPESAFLWYTLSLDAVAAHYANTSSLSELAPFEVSDVESKWPGVMTANVVSMINGSRWSMKVDGYSANFQPVKR